MRLPLALPVLLSACGFSGGDGTAPDARPPPECVPGFVNVCGQDAPGGNLIVSNLMINTDADDRCRTVTQTGGPNICLFYFTDVEVQAGGTVTAYGSRPFALVATNEMTIAGTIDVSSQRLRPTMRGAGSNPSGLCTSIAVPESAEGGGGGGAGGSFGTAGGLGGNGNLDGSDSSQANRAGGKPGAALAKPGVLRGGCDGQDGGPGDLPSGGAPGQGGGAIYLSAPRLSVLNTGVVRAGGSGGSTPTGTDDAGGGGGSGGAIILESPLINVAGKLVATGGGGARGANGGTDGAFGGDGIDITPAPGGSAGGASSGGPGGAGGTDTVGGNGMPNNGGGGGGGGGTGFVVLLGGTLMTEGGLMMPPYTATAK